jgi:Mg-chelatase subunit ChlD
LVLWDHRVIDMSDQVQDPLEVLMATQLGGGTKLAPALRHCAGLVRDPRRTALVVLSDFVLFGDGAESLRLAAELHEAGVRGLGLLALDEIGRPQYDEAFARQLADTGWSVAALTPKKLAELLGPMLRS